MFALTLVACGPALQVPSDREPIEHVGRGKLEKGGVPLDGFTCGETYETAVAGVREAETEMRACWQANVLYGGGILGSLVLAPVALVTAHDGGSHALVDTELGAMATSFLVGYIAAWLAGHQMNRAIHVYNAAVR